ncbi:MAG: shikimate dehydrogenase family protein [Actinomycetota bacterium]
MTIKLAVLGNPISHSLSPKLHLAAYHHLDLPWSYSAIQTEASELSKVLNENNLQAASITMPLKEEAFEFSSIRDVAAEATKTVNTLISTKTGWAGHNTDVYGIEMALDGISPSSSLLIGTGATARSAIYALSNLQNKPRVSIWGRDPQKLQQSLDFASRLGLNASAAPNLGSGLESADLVISTVPGQASSEIWQGVDQIPNKAVLFDIAYSPWPSPAAVVFQGHNVISGLEMLIWQATEQVRLFCEHFDSTIRVDNRELYQVMRTSVSSI